MAIIPAGFGQATFVFNIPGPGGPAMITFGFMHNDAATPNDEANTIRIAFTQTGSLMPSMDSNATLVETRTLVRLDSGELVSGVDTTNSSGGLSQVGSPPQVAALYQKRTGFAGRNRRGRFYLPAPESFPESGIYGASTITGQTGRSRAFLANLDTAGSPMYLLHNSLADAPNEVTDLVCIGTAATQRRRIR